MATPQILRGQDEPRVGIELLAGLGSLSGPNLYQNSISMGFSLRGGAFLRIVRRVGVTANLHTMAEIRSGDNADLAVDPRKYDLWGGTMGLAIDLWPGKQPSRVRVHLDGGGYRATAEVLGRNVSRTTPAIQFAADASLSQGDQGALFASMRFLRLRGVNDKRLSFISFEFGIRVW